MKFQSMTSKIYNLYSEIKSKNDHEFEIILKIYSELNRTFSAKGLLSNLNNCNCHPICQNHTFHILIIFINYRGAPVEPHNKLLCYNYINKTMSL